MEKEMMSIPEASKCFGVSDKWLRERVKKGEIPYRKSGWKYLINRDNLKSFLTGADAK